MSAEHHRIVIVGAGFAGLGAAIRLEQAGIDDYVVLERAPDVGGTWWFNTYPGCQCDIPSHLYSFSFAPNPDWSQTFSKQEEIQRYLRGCAERFGILPRVRLNTELELASWDDEAGLWRLTTSAGELSADILLTGAGSLVEPKLTAVPGVESFAGTTFHSARWDHDHDLTGERVAVIGTGASAIQFVPEIQPKVGRLDVYQRTPPWIARHTNRRTTRFERTVYRRFPPAQRAARAGVYVAREALVPGLRGNAAWQKVMQGAARSHLHKQVGDPELRRKLTPDYAMGCKRMLISNDWYPALTKPNVELVTDAIAEVRPHSIVAVDGAEREVDTIIYATGFYVTDAPIAHRIRGRGGRSLAAEWEGSPRAYMGTTIAGYPNLFMISGPNTGLGHNSVVYMIESQIEHIMRALGEMERRGAGVIEPRPEAQEAYTQWIQRQMPGTVWTSGGCASWYIDSKGINTALWPTFTFEFRRRLRAFDASAYVLAPRAPRGPAQASHPEAQPA
jgi:cation diffusion facilitator CzcD-associated flavoprotein CzcO